MFWHYAPWGSRTDLQNKEKFTELAHYAPLIAGDDETKAKKFQRRLRSAIRTMMIIARLKTFAEIVEMTRLIEQDCDELAKSRDKSVKHPQPGGPRKAKHANRAGMTKMPRQTNFKPPYPKCARFHAGAWFRETSACYKCHLVGHIIHNYPSWKKDQVIVPEQTKQNAKVPGRVYTITKQDAQAFQSVVTGILSLFDYDAQILIDPGSTHSFIVFH